MPEIRGQIGLDPEFSPHSRGYAYLGVGHDPVCWVLPALAGVCPPNTNEWR